MPACNVRRHAFVSRRICKGEQKLDEVCARDDAVVGGEFLMRAKCGAGLDGWVWVASLGSGFERLIGER